MERDQRTHVAKAQGVLRTQLAADLKHHFTRKIDFLLSFEDCRQQIKGSDVVTQHINRHNIHIAMLLTKAANRFRKRVQKIADNATLFQKS